MNRQIDYMNVIRLATSTDYQNRIPVATQNNLANIQNDILADDSMKNEFLNVLVNKIALTKVLEKTYENKLKTFKKEKVDLGTTVEEIVTDILSAQVFDPTDTAVFQVVKPDVACMFHIENVKLKYKVSISYEQLKGAFKSADGLNKLIQTVVNQLMNSDNYDEYLMMKELLKRINAYDVNIPALDGTSTTTKTFIRAIKDYIGLAGYMNRNFNEIGFASFSKPEDLRLIIRHDAKLDIDMEVLSTMFHKDLATFEAETITVDNFNDDDFTYAMIVDKDIIADHDTLLTTRNAENPSALVNHYWKHHWSIKSLSKFVTAIRIRKEIEPTAITLNKSSATLSIAGEETVQLKLATVTPTNASYTELDFTSADSEKVTVDENGLCKAVGGSANDTVVITAKVHEKNTVTATCTITLSA